MKGSFVHSRASIRIVALVVVSLLVSLVFAKPLTIGLSASDIQSLDPQFGGTLSPEGPMVELLYNGLVRFPPGTTDLANMEPDLAESWSTNDDLTVWTFVLRQGVEFHDGYGELKASDVKFSLERNLTETSPWRSSYLNVASISSTDDYTVVITLKAPDPFFLLTVNNYRGGFVVSQQAVEERGDSFQLDPVGTGPFSFTSYQSRNSISFAAHPDYFRGAPALEGVEFRFMPDQSSREIALRRGAIDMINSDADQRWLDTLTKSGEFELILIGPGVPYYLHINQTTPGLDDVRVRRAIQHAVNRDEINSFLGADVSTPIVSPVPAGYFGHTSDLRVYEHDVSKAKSLLAEAGFANGLTLHVVNSENLDYLNMMTLLQEQLRRVGITVDLEVVDHSSWHSAIRANESDLVVYSFTRPPVADIVLAQFFAADAIVGKPTAVTNFSHYDNIEELLAEARRTTDSSTKREAYEAAQRQIMEDAVVVPLASNYWIFVKPTDLDLGLPSNTVDSLNYAFPINETTPGR